MSPINGYLLVVPVLIYFVSRFYRDVPRTLKNLEGRGVLALRQRATESDLSPGDLGFWRDLDHEESGRSRIRTIGVLLAAGCVLLPVAALVSGLTSDRLTWLYGDGRPTLAGVWFYPLVHGALLYILFRWALDLWVVSGVIARALSKCSDVSLDIQVDHPDGCMGLAPVGDVSRYAIWIIICCSLIVFSWQIGAWLDLGDSGKTYVEVLCAIVFKPALDAESVRSLGWLAAWIVYLAVTPIAFFAPMSAAQGVMNGAKEKRMCELSRAFLEGSSDDERRQAKERYGEVSSIAVWPVTRKSVGSFGASIVSPLLLALLTQLSADLLSKVTGQTG